eukprot:1912552-Prymnesium_polylepis.2
MLTGPAPATGSAAPDHRCAALGDQPGRPDEIGRQHGDDDCACCRQATGQLGGLAAASLAERIPYRKSAGLERPREAMPLGRWLETGYAGHPLQLYVYGLYDCTMDCTPRARGPFAFRVCASCRRAVDK